MTQFNKEMEAALTEDAKKLEALTGKQHMYDFDAYVIDKREEQDELQAFGEYRAHGGKLDFTAWQERQGRI